MRDYDTFGSDSPRSYSRNYDSPWNIGPPGPPSSGVYNREPDGFNQCSIEMNALLDKMGVINIKELDESTEKIQSTFNKFNILVQNNLSNSHVQHRLIDIQDRIVKILDTAEKIPATVGKNEVSLVKFLKEELKAEAELLYELFQKSTQSAAKEADVKDNIAAAQASFPTIKIIEASILKNVDKNKAEEILKKSPVGSFLVRHAAEGVDFQLKDLPENFQKDKKKRDDNIKVVSYLDKNSGKIVHTVLGLGLSHFRHDLSKYKELGVMQSPAYDSIGQFLAEKAKVNAIDYDHHIDSTKIVLYRNLYFERVQEILKTIEVPKSFILIPLSHDYQLSTVTEDDKPGEKIFSGAIKKIEELSAGKGKYDFPYLTKEQVDKLIKTQSEYGINFNIKNNLLDPTQYTQVLVWVDDKGVIRHTLFYKLKTGFLTMDDQGNNVRKVNSIEEYIASNKQIDRNNMITPAIVQIKNEREQLIKEREELSGRKTSMMKPQDFRILSEQRDGLKQVIIDIKVEKIKKEMEPIKTEIDKLCKILQVEPTRLKDLPNTIEGALKEKESLQQELNNYKEIFNDRVQVRKQAESLNAEHDKLLDMLGRPASEKIALSPITDWSKLQQQRELLRKNIPILRQQVWEMQANLAAKDKPRPFLLPNDSNDLPRVQLSRAHYQSGISSAPIPEPPSDVDISKLNEFIQNPKLRKPIANLLVQNFVDNLMAEHPRGPNEPESVYLKFIEEEKGKYLKTIDDETDKFIKLLSDKIEAFKMGDKVTDKIGKEFPKEYVASGKKVLGWITKHYRDRFVEIAQMKKTIAATDEAETKKELEAEVSKKLEKLEDDFANTVVKLADSILYCFKGASEELQILYNDLGFVSAEEAMKSYDANNLPNKIILLGAKHRLELFEKMFMHNLHVPSNIRPEYEQHYHNVFADEFGLGSREFSKVKTELDHLANPALEEMFRSEFNKLHNAETFTDFITKQIDKNKIPKEWVLFWFGKNYPDIDASELMLPDGKNYNPKAIAVMLRDLGMIDWPQLILTPEQSLTKIQQYKEQAAKVESIEEICRYSIQVIDDLVLRLLPKIVDTETGKRMNEKANDLRGALDARANLLYKLFEKKLESISAKPESVEQDLKIYDEAIESLNFLSEDAFQSENLKSIPALQTYIAGLNIRLQSLRDKQFLLNLKVIQKKLESTNFEELDKSIKFAKGMVSRLRSTEKIEDVTDEERKGFINEIEGSIEKATTRLEKMRAEQTTTAKPKEPVETTATPPKMDYHSIGNKRLAEWDGTIENGFDSFENWEKFGKDLNTDEHWNIMRRGNLETNFRSLLTKWRKAKPAK